MYIAVTGSSGKLGRPAVAALRKAGHRVVGLDINVPIDPARAILSLRFSNVFAREDYEQMARLQANPAWRKMNLWSYVDADDAGEG
jgi:nucleoside-diphosphate-sugar epimerase